jgi:hypothetical protein
MRSRFVFLELVVIIISMCIISCVPKPLEVEKVEAPPPERVVFVNSMTFSSEVETYDGFVLVLFYNKEFWQSKDMERRFSYFADKFYGKAKFCKFHWALNADGKPYRLEMLPTVVLYDHGTEVDRIKGIPPDERTRLKWNNDIELWFLKNVLGLKGSKYAGEYTYFFKNSHTLHIGNY